MSKMIIKNSMMGNIVAYNQNDGVCFTITIPVEDEEGTSNE